jgi:hypothetical protein
MIGINNIVAQRLDKLSKKATVIVAPTATPKIVRIASFTVLNAINCTPNSAAKRHANNGPKSHGSGILNSKKMLTPKIGSLKQAYDPNKINADGSKGGVVYASDREIRQKKLTPALPTETIAQTPGGGLTIEKSYGQGGGSGASKNIERANDLKITTFAMNNVADAMIENLSTAKVGTVGGTISALDSIGSQLNQAAQSFGFAKNL